jgi:hypothetical protein
VIVSYVSLRDGPVAPTGLTLDRGVLRVGSIVSWARQPKSWRTLRDRCAAGSFGILGYGEPRRLKALSRPKYGFDSRYRYQVSDRYLYISQLLMIRRIRL